jgi:hypothetical protein
MDDIVNHGEISGSHGGEYEDGSNLPRKILGSPHILPPTRIFVRK